MDIFTQSSLLRADHEAKVSDALEDYISGEDILRQAGKNAVSALPILRNELTTFYNDVSTEKTVRVGKGIYIGGTLQTVPYSGVIQHNELINLDANDHPQYLTNTGGLMSGNLSISGVWINSKGVDNLGISFKANSEESESFIIGDNTSLVFDNDNSKMDSGGSVAKAFIAFDSTENPIVVKSSYNVQTIQKISNGKFVITFKDKITDAYTAITSSNGLTGDLAEDVSFVSASCSLRKQDSCSFVVQNKAGEYVDSTTNDLVIFSIN